MDKIAEFVRKKRVIKDAPKIDFKEVKVPWYRRPLEREEFTFRKAKNASYYVRHIEWGKHVWIGPYKTIDDVNGIINAYLEESLKEPLDRKSNCNIHSITVDDETAFFQ
jgi:hypothetical protein